MKKISAINWKHLPGIGLPLAVWLLSLWLLNIGGEFPLNDDWQYAYAVKHALEQGELEYRGVFSPIVLAQVMWGRLFCMVFAGGVFSFGALRCSTLVLVWVGGVILLALHQLLGGQRQDRALLGSVYLGAPLVLALGVSFMSDVPFMAVALAAVYAYMLYLDRHQTGYLVAAWILSALAFFIRQPGVLLPVAMGIHQLLLGKNTRSMFFMLGMAGFGAALYLLWSGVLKPGLGLEDNFKTDELAYLQTALSNPLGFVATLGLRLLKSWVYLGFFSLPMLAYSLRNRIPARVWGAALALATALVGASHLAGKPFPFGGNIFFNLGLGPELLVDTYTLGLANTPGWPHWTMDVLHALAVVHGVVLGYGIAVRWRQWTPLLRAYAWFWLVFSVPYFMLMGINSYYDRYVLLPLVMLWPLITMLGPPLAAGESAASAGRGWYRYLRWVPVVIGAWFALAASHDYLSWNRAALEARNWLIDEVGAEPGHIDAGYALNGWYNYGMPRREDDETSFWWVQDDRYRIAFGPTPGYAVLKAYPYRRWLWGKTDALRVLERK
jgi:hypothetical protein